LFKERGERKERKVTRGESRERERRQKKEESKRFFKKEPHRGEKSSPYGRDSFLLINDVLLGQTHPQHHPED